jgi:transcription antitermination factor NusG
MNNEHYESDIEKEIKRLFKKAYSTKSIQPVYQALRHLKSGYDAFVEETGIHDISTFFEVTEIHPPLVTAEEKFLDMYIFVDMMRTIPPKQSSEAINVTRMVVNHFRTEQGPKLLDIGITYKLYEGEDLFLVNAHSVGIKIGEENGF